MKLKFIVAEDFVNYKKPSMFIGFPNCSFKCDKECGQEVCQNSSLVKSPTHDVPVDKIVLSYLNNSITKALVCQGLEPFDSKEDLYQLIKFFRKYADDDIVIYTGYTEEELFFDIEFLKRVYKNIIIKFGRFIPNQPSYYDETLGVFLASSNQYAKKIC
jgi:organic radical activating enzyme